jgi:hypothetical protein
VPISDLKTAGDKLMGVPKTMLLIAETVCMLADSDFRLILILVLGDGKSTLSAFFASLPAALP